MSAKIGDFADNCQLCLVAIECACDRGIPFCVNCSGRVPLARAHRLSRTSGPNNYITHALSTYDTASLNEAGAIRDYNNNIDNYNYNNNGNFKTRGCIPHYRGACSHGRQCSFAHSEAELLNNNNNNNNQNNFKPEMCKNLIRGNCSFGFQCSFAHSEPELFPYNNNNNNSLAVSHRSSRKQWVVVTRTAEQQQQPQTQQTVPHSLAEFE
ncbi:unnamed protein product [Polarella glacialis]|uniref:C3H1-type domain-containing protein n=1 Tax=Polarella glacialis TaxID=89957 RepID=A0A813FMZ7_POLGL|nr:unnamed protein product [Polarella glacialis]